MLRQLFRFNLHLNNLTSLNFLIHCFLTKVYQVHQLLILSQSYHIGQKSLELCNCFLIRKKVLKDLLFSKYFDKQKVLQAWEQI